MKRLLFAFCLVCLAACKHDYPEFIDLEKYSPTESKRGFTVIRESNLDLSDRSLWGENWNSEVKVKASSTNLILSVSGILSSVLSNSVHQVVGTYLSTDLHGNPITVSGKIVYPTKRAIKNMMVVSHYTIGANSECPSEGFSFESLYAALGYAVVIADYIGFGVTVNEIHPYLQADVCAANVIDMALVARPFLEERGLKPQSDEIILLGYSQGGANTLHVQRLLETYPKYMGQFKIKKNYAGSGPYDIARTYDFSVKKDVTGIPCAIPMIIQGMSIGMEKPLNMSYFFREPLLSNYEDWLNSKKYTVLQISTKIGSNKLSEILTKDATDKSKTETARFYKELINNSIPKTYLPDAPLYMFHSQDDQTVPFINSQLMENQFRDSELYGAAEVEYDFDHYGNHQQGAMKFILKVAKILD